MSLQNPNAPSRREFLSLPIPFAFAAPDFIETIEEATRPDLRGRLALVIGHTKLRPGAYGIGLLRQHEYSFNTLVAAEITGICKKRKIEVKSFTRDIGGVKTAYEGAIRWGADAVVELHFNSTRRRIDKVQGTETLSAGGSQVASFQLAEAIQKTTVQALKRPASLDRGVKTCKLRRNYACPAILTEPAFGNCMEDARLLATRRSAVSNAIVDGFVDFQRLKLKPQAERPQLPKDLTILPNHVAG